jgi:hypothetical protein
MDRRLSPTQEDLGHHSFGCAGNLSEQGRALRHQYGNDTDLAIFIWLKCWREDLTVSLQNQRVRREGGKATMKRDEPRSSEQPHSRRRTNGRDGLQKAKEAEDQLMDLESWDSITEAEFEKLAQALGANMLTTEDMSTGALIRELQTNPDTPYGVVIALFKRGAINELLAAFPNDTQYIEQHYKDYLTAHHAFAKWEANERGEGKK